MPSPERKRADVRNHRPLQITAELRTPVITDEWLPFDGMLYHQAMRERWGGLVLTWPGANNNGAQPVRLPLKKCGVGEEWYYAASFAQPRQWWVVEGIDHWAKRFDQSLVSLLARDGKRCVLNTRSGRYKLYHMPVFYRCALRVQWYVVGSQRRIKELLCTLTNIGKKGSQGWGRVSAWHVEPCAEDWSEVRDGQLTRALPVTEATQRGLPFELAHYGIRPSYHASANLLPVAMPV